VSSRETILFHILHHYHKRKGFSIGMLFQQILFTQNIDFEGLNSKVFIRMQTLVHFYFKHINTIVSILCDVGVAVQIKT